MRRWLMARARVCPYDVVTLDKNPLNIPCRPVGKKLRNDMHVFVL